MSSTDETEISQALEIARNLRANILNGKGSLESHLHAFYTTAQILNRVDDIKWITGEITGEYDPLPDYRKKRFKRFNLNARQILEALDDDTLSDADCRTTISEIIAELSGKESERVQMGITSSEFELVKKYRSGYEKTKFSCIFPNLELEKILSLIKFEQLTRLNVMISELTYGKIPRGIFRKFQDKVNKKLAESNPDAISELNIAYESLGKSEDPERISHVAFACRRLIKAVADGLYAPKENKKYKLKSGDEIEIGKEKFLNRLQAFVDSIDSPNRKFLNKKIGLLRDLYGEIPQSINKGTHLNISNADAEDLVLYTYIILGDIILEESKFKKTLNEKHESE